MVLPFLVLYLTQARGFSVARAGADRSPCSDRPFLALTVLGRLYSPRWTTPAKGSR